jgi:hypothetical protein
MGHLELVRKSVHGKTANCILSIPYATDHESDDFSKAPKRTSKKKKDTQSYVSSEDAYIYEYDSFSDKVSDKVSNARKKKSGVSDSIDYTYSSSELDCDSEDSKSKKKQSSRKEREEELCFSSESELSDASIIICESPTSDDDISSSNAQLFPLSDADAKRIHEEVTAALKSFKQSVCAVCDNLVIERDCVHKRISKISTNFIMK